MCDYGGSIDPLDDTEAVIHRIVQAYVALFLNCVSVRVLSVRNVAWCCSYQRQRQVPAGCLIRYQWCPEDSASTALWATLSTVQTDNVLIADAGVVLPRGLVLPVHRLDGRTRVISFAETGESGASGSLLDRLHDFETKTESLSLLLQARVGTPLAVGGALSLWDRRTAQTVYEHVHAGRRGADCDLETALQLQRSFRGSHAAVTAFTPVQRRRKLGNEEVRLI